MVNIRTNKKRKSNYNSAKLSRKVKRGGLLEGLFGFGKPKPAPDTARPADTARSADTGQPAKPAEPADTAKPAEPADTAKPAEPAQPADVAELRKKLEQDLDRMYIITDADYTKALQKIKEAYPFISDNSIANGDILDADVNKIHHEEWATIPSKRVNGLLRKMKNFKDILVRKKIQDYTNLLQDSVVVYPYARIQTHKDRELKQFKERELERE
jgi:hypothetical protein